MKKLAAFILLYLLVGSTFFAQASTKNGVLDLGQGQTLYFESLIPAGSRRPVYVFLPGIYRGHRSEDHFVRLMRKEKMSYVLFHFAEQPDSIVHGEKGNSPDFSESSPESLAQQMEILVESLEIKRAIPVTLSYSAIVSQHLDPRKFPNLIEVAPIAQDTDGLPEAIAEFYRQWSDYIKAFPFGEVWLRNAKIMQLRQHWAGTVDSYAKRFPELKQSLFRERAIAGYTALTLASENFDLRKQDFARGPKRHFILAENEEAGRAKIQDEAVQIYEEETGHLHSSQYVPQSGHVVMSDQPEAFVKALRGISF